MAELQSMKDRRLQNLDASIGYYAKRLTSYKKQKAKLEKLPRTSDTENAINVIQALIALLEDVISYLKLC